VDAHREVSGGPLRDERFVHGHVAWSMLLPRSSEDRFDQAAFDADERLPYWADLWPSAKALARHLLDGPPIGGSALELGCGVGLVALALAERGATVTATDYEAAALDFVRRNAERNGFAAPRTATMDWRAPDRRLRAPLVVGADVLYERRNAESLASAVPELVSEGGVALIADPRRPWRGAFIDGLRRRGWTAAETVLPAELGPGNKPVEIVLLTCRAE
jgi:predicted nicotinamide N-methyase